MTPRSHPSRSASGLVAGGRGGPEDELLQDGQEEVFSRAEVETGSVEHGVGEDDPRARTDDQDG